jgi:hypothetical protein
MTKITVEQVVQAMQDVLSRPHNPLPVETVEVLDVFYGRIILQRQEQRCLSDMAIMLGAITQGAMPRHFVPGWALSHYGTRHGDQ